MTNTSHTNAKFHAEPISKEEHKAWLIDSLKKCIESEMAISGYCRNLSRKADVTSVISFSKKIPDASHQYDAQLRELFKNIKSFDANPNKSHKDALSTSLNACEQKRKRIVEFIENYLKAYPTSDGSKFDMKLRYEFDKEMPLLDEARPFPHDFKYLKTLTQYLIIIDNSNTTSIVK